MKAMRKVSRGKGFRGAVSYAIDREGQEQPGRIIGGNMSGDTPRALSAEFAAGRKVRPDIEKPVWHQALRAPKGETMTDEKWVAFADDYMQSMGFTDLNQRVYIIHDDEDGQHIHIVSNRVGLDGKVFLGKNENLESTRIVGELEKVYGLTVTKGPTFDPDTGKVQGPEVRKPKAREMDMGIERGVMPPRMAIQQAVDAALASGKPMTAPAFIKALEAHGVNVVPNVASTGKLNGFSFETGGIAFTGSQLGDRYKWTGLQKKGVEYEQNRDFTALADAKRLGTERRERQSADREPTAADRPAAPSAGPGTGPAGPDRAGSAAGIDGDRPDNSLAAPDAGPTHERDERSGGQELRGDDSQTVRAGGQAGDERHSIGDGPVSIEGDSRSAAGQAQDGAGRGQQLNDRPEGLNERHQEGGPEGEAAALENGPDDVRSSPSGSSDVNGGWSARFKQASAAARRADRPGNSDERRVGQVGLVQGVGQRARITDEHRQSARTVDPTPALEREGFEVKQEGRHMSVRLSGDEIYRVTKQADGHYVACHHDGAGIGDNIALMRTISPGAGFAEAVFQLSGGPSMGPDQTAARRKQREKDQERQRPTLPPLASPEQAQRGRYYLERIRKVGRAVIDFAEKHGVLRFARDAVLFVGRDSHGEVRSATRRAIDPADEIQKRDLYGSNKAHPMVLPGNPASVWIVEGGMDALALHDIARKRGHEAPTVIVSGGVRNRSYLDNPAIQERLRGADRVTIAGEVEKTPEIQQQTDADRAKLAGRVREVSGKEPALWMPEKGKDLAERNQKEPEAKERSRDMGMSMGR